MSETVRSSESEQEASGYSSTSWDPKSASSKNIQSRQDILR